MTLTVPPGRLWFGLLAAPAAWVVQGLAGWLVGARICGDLGVGTVRAAAGGVSLTAFAVAVAGLSIGWRNWDRVRREPRPPDDRVAFLALGGLLVSSAFFVGIAWASLNALFLNACGRIR